MCGKLCYSWVEAVVFSELAMGFEERADSAIPVLRQVHNKDMRRYMQACNKKHNELYASTQQGHDEGHDE